MQNFINLRNYSDYSLGISANKIADLVTHFADDRAFAVALTDKYNLFASLEFSLAALKKKLLPIIGNVLRLKLPEFGNLEDDLADIMLIAKDEKGIKNLIKLSSLSYLESADNRDVHITKQQLLDHSEGVILLYGGPNSWAEKLIANDKIDDAHKLLKELANIFKENIYIEISRNKRDIENVTESHLLQFALSEDLPIVGTSEGNFPKISHHAACDALMCIANGRYLLEDNRPKADKFGYLKTQTELLELFSDLPEAAENSLNIAKKISYYMDYSKPFLPGYEDLKPGNTLSQELEEQSKEGLEKRLQGLHYEFDRKVYEERLQYELGVINQMDYPGYFLIVSDFIKWSKNNEIPVGPGRGSGAGSVVAWSLKITDLDPLRYDLLFERFLNPERVSMPDFDIDFCQDRRDEVIQYVTKKYGADKVAQILTFGKLQARAVLRDVGRVLQIPYIVVDNICKLVPHNPANPVTLAEAIALDKSLQNMAKGDEQIDDLLKISLQLEGVNRHLSTHAAGIVIANKSLDEIVPVYKDQNTEMPAVQYTMKYAEAAGLVKFDFLGLKTLTVISWCCKEIWNTKPGFVLDSSDFTDKKTYQLLTSGRTTGVFQFEGAGMKEAIKKLKPDRFEDIIALGSLYRPGPMENIPSYVNRKHGLEEPKYLHPLLANVLEETYGIIVYQEQVMEIAQTFAGFTLGGADLLRRAMGKKIKSEMEALRSQFVEGCVKTNDVKRDLAEEVFELVNKFASYGFNKSHAAAYAVLSYQTAFLKANHTAEFLIASINLEIQDTDKINLFVQEARDFKIPLQMPNVNISSAYFKLEDGNMIYGLAALKNVGIKLVEAMILERKQNGKYEDIFDFVTRLDGIINKRALESLVKAGALDDFAPNRHQIHHNAEKLMQFGAYQASANRSKQQSLFGEEVATAKVELDAILEWTPQEKLTQEFEAVGFYLSRHPLDTFRHKLNQMRAVFSKDVENYASQKGSQITVAGVITSKKIRSSKRGKFAFMQLSDEYGLLEVSIFDEQLLYKHADQLVVGNACLFTIDVKEDDAGTRVVITEVMDLDDTLNSVETKFIVYLEDETGYRKLQSYLRDSGHGSGIRVDIAFEGKGGTVFIGGLQKYLNYDDMINIRNVSGLKIKEV